MPTIASSALQLQEICDHIADSLSHGDASLENLRSTSLISRVFCASSQAQLFRVIRLGRYGRHPSVIRLHALLLSSPHLIPYIRCLSVPIQDYTFSALAHIRFSGLREIHYFSDLEDNCPVGLGQLLIAGLPLCKLSLSGILRPFADFYDLFHNLPSTLDTLHLNTVHPTGLQKSDPFRGKLSLIKDLTLINSPRLGKWLAHPASPFDFTQLQSISIHDSWSPVIFNIVSTAHRSITQLKTDASTSLPQMSFRLTNRRLRYSRQRVRSLSVPRTERAHFGD